MIKPNIIVYTDGSSRGNPGPGGYGIVMQKFGSNYIKEFSEGYRRTTNNRMELLAVIISLEKIDWVNIENNKNSTRLIKRIGIIYCLDILILIYV